MSPEWHHVRGITEAWPSYDDHMEPPSPTPAEFHLPLAALTCPAVLRRPFYDSSLSLDETRKLASLTLILACLDGLVYFPSPLHSTRTSLVTRLGL